MRKLIVILFILIAPSICNATVYHVATDGSGDYTTIAQVNAATFNAGDQVLFKSGDSWDERLDIIDVTRVSYSSYGAGDLPEIRRVVVTNADGCSLSNVNLVGGTEAVARLYINDTDGFVFKDSEINYSVDDSRYARAVSIHSSAATKETKNITIDNNYIDCGVHNISGINVGNSSGYIDASNIIITNNEVIGGNEINIQTYGKYHYIYNVLIKGNISRSAQQQLVGETLSTGHGINVGWRTINSEVSNNYVETSKRYGIVLDSGVTDCTVKNNVLYNNLYNIGTEGSGEICSNVNFYNNTSIGGDTTLNTGIRLVSPSGSYNYTIKNNIFYISTQGSSDYIVQEAITSDIDNLILDHNIYYDGDGAYLFLYDDVAYNTFEAYQTATGQDANSIIGDPKFLTSSNFALQSDSPAINAGIDLDEVKYDFRYLGRPQGASTDIGAYEYGNLTSAQGLTLSGITIGE